MTSNIYTDKPDKKRKTKTILISQTPEELFVELLNTMQLSSDERYLANKTLKQINCMQLTRRLFEYRQIFGFEFQLYAGATFGLKSTEPVFVLKSEIHHLHIRIIYSGDQFQLMINNVFNETRYTFYSENANITVHTPLEVLIGLLDTIETKGNISFWVHKYKYI